MRAAFVLAGLAGCLSPATYTCDTNADCTGGAGGICEETTRVCSFLDPSCASGRRIGAYGGDLSNTCTAERRLSNACVAGEPWPTSGDPCTAQVCARLPSCCEVSWGEACVRAADSLCDVHCGKWIATTGMTESNLLRWDPDAKDYASVGTLPGAGGVIAWVDARDTRPRLAQGRGKLAAVYSPVGDVDPPMYTEEAFRFDGGDGAVLRAVTAVDTNRDDAVEVGLLFGGTGQAIVALLGGDGGPVAMATSSTLGGSEAIGWADVTGDRIPDFAVGMATGYRLYYFSETLSSYQEGFEEQFMGNRFATVGWDDMDGDGRLDLVAVGTILAIHLNDDPDNFGGAPRQMTRSPGAGNELAVGTLGDLDGDGRAELVAASTTLAKVGVFVWNGTAGALNASAVFDIGPYVQVALADVDDDRRLDVLAIPDTGGLVWCRNASTPGVFVLEPPRVIAAAGQATSFAVTGWPAR